MRLSQAILLDLDDTIVDYSGGTERCWEEACFHHAADLGVIDPRTLYLAIGQTREWYWADPERHRRGRLDLDAAAREVVALSLAELGADDLPLAAKIAGAYRVQREAGIQPFPDAVETIRWLRERGCRLALVTNGAAVIQRSKVTRFELTALFDTILIEEEVGFGKPDPRIYTHALQQLDVDASEASMVGDHLEFDVGQPQRLGLAGIWVDIRGTGLPDSTAVRPDRIVRGLSELRRPT